jgi:hypothetical protein
MIFGKPLHDQVVASAEGILLRHLPGDAGPGMKAVFSRTLQAMLDQGFDLAGNAKQWKRDYVALDTCGLLLIDEVVGHMKRTPDPDPEADKRIETYVYVLQNVMGAERNPHVRTRNGATGRVWARWHEMP